MALNHANAGAHLYSQSMNIDAVVQRGERGVGMAQTLQSSILPCAWTGDQPCFRDESAEGLMQVFDAVPSGKRNTGKLTL